MKIRDFIQQDIDIDVYDSVCDGIGIAFVGPMKLTEAGEKKFAEVLDYDISIIMDGSGFHNAIVDTDAPEGEWQQKLGNAKQFFWAAAGYCSCEDYELWFE